MNACKVDDEIAITGMSGCFPECENIEEFKMKLYGGTDMVSNDPARWPDGTYGLHTYGGKIRTLDTFDAPFFGINTKQANCLDPQLRLLLELTHEAIVDAGINPSELRGTNTAVFIGVSNSDAWELNVNPETPTGYELIGAARSMVANRISYAFDFKGRSCVVDTACSSSLTALHMAVDAIRTGQCDAAVVGGANVLLNPTTSVQFAKLGVFSKACRSFDADAKGYVRSESVAVLFLQRTERARRIYATIVGIKSNTDGYKVEGPTFPSTKMQYELLASLYKDARINPDEVYYVEAHGTGTAAGDPAEVNALAEMFCPRTRPLYLGSVKSNIGHTESASGAVGLVKAILGFETGAIAANLNFETPNPAIPALVDGRIRVVTEHLPYENGLVGVSNVGFGGTNTHVVVRPNRTSERVLQPPPNVVLVSGRTGEAVHHLLDNLEVHHNDPEFAALLNKVHELPIPRHSYRGYAIPGKTREVGKLTDESRPLWYVYAGMGSHWTGMAKQLMTIDVFRRTMEKCAAALKPYGVDLMRQVTVAPQEELDALVHCSPSIMAVEVALTDVLASLGLKPDGIVGHSLGETGCAYADGALTAEEAVLVAFIRGKGTAETSLTPGLMAAVGLSWEECEERCPHDVFPACNNAPNNVTVSGPRDSIKRFVQDLQSHNVFAKIVNTSSVAFHSKYIADAGPKILEYMRRVIASPKQRTPKWISSSVPQIAWSSDLARTSSAEYHANNFLSPVLFLEALAEVPDNAVVVEIAPHCLLQSVLKRALGPGVAHVGLVNKNLPDVLHGFRCSLGRIFLNGRQPRVASLDAPIAFPVSRGTPMIAPLIKWDHSEKLYTPYFKPRSKFGVYVTVDLKDPDNAYLYDYVLDGTTVFPATGVLVVVWKAFALALMRDFETLAVVFERVDFPNVLDVTSNKYDFLVAFFQSSGAFEVVCDGTVVCKGTIRLATEARAASVKPQTTQCVPLEPKDVYKYLLLLGFEYGDAFKTIQTLDDGAQTGTVKWTNNWTVYLDALVQTSIVHRQSNELLQLRSVKKVSINPNETKRTTFQIIGNVLTSGAVEICKPGFEKRARARHCQRPHRVDEYIFLPDETSNAIRDTRNVLLASLQLVSENCGTALKVCELSLDARDLLTPSVKHLVDIEKGLTADYTLVTSETDVDLEDVTVTSVPSENSAHLMLASRVSKDDSIDLGEYASFIIKEGGFLLLEDASHNLDGLDFKQVAKHTVDDRVFRLFRYISLVPQNVTVVRASQDDFSWLKQLQNANFDSSTVYLVARVTGANGFLGAFNSLKVEPNKHNVRLFLIEDPNLSEFDPNHSDYARRIRMDLKTNVYVDGAWGSYRNLLAEDFKPKRVPNAQAEFDETSGTFKWFEIVPKSSGNDCWVHSVAVTAEITEVGGFNTHLESVMGNSYPAVSCFAGVNAQGVRVMGVTRGPMFGTCVQLDENFTWTVPDDWTFEDAATVPGPYVMAHYALAVKAKVDAETRLLITVGDVAAVAAIAVAQPLHCQLLVCFDTADRKREYSELFPELKERFVYEPDQLVRDEIVRDGVDLILNYTDDCRCLDYLDENGAFLQMVQGGKFEDFVEAVMSRNVTFCNVRLQDAFQCNEVARLVKKGAKTPLPKTLFTRHQIKNALKRTNATTHIVNIFEGNETTILAQPTTFFSPSKSYIMVGGLGGLGLQLMRWMTTRGARKFVVNARSGVTTGYQTLCVRALRETGVTLIVSKEDASTDTGARKLVQTALALGPVGGIFNTAVVVQDALFENQTEESFRAVSKPTVAVMRNLDARSREMCPELDHFVQFAPVGYCYGFPGQTNFAMANKTLEELLRLRRKDGFPSKLINLGAIGDVGMWMEAAGFKDHAHTHPQRVPSILATVDEFLQRPETVLCSYLVAEKDRRANSPNAENDDRGSQIQHVVAKCLDVKDVDALGANVTLTDLGIDSLMAANILQALAEDFGVDLSTEELRAMTFPKLKGLGDKDSAV